MDNKIEKSIAFIQSVNKRFLNPCLYFSGGKDSIVMLHLVLTTIGRLPVVFHREPFNHEKYEFGMRVLAHYGLTAHDYPPLKVSLWLGKEILAYTNHYQIGLTRDKKPTTLDLPKNLLPPDKSNDCLCGLQDILRRPTGYFNYPWDLAFIGHKDCDSDQIAGDTHLYADVVQNQGGPSLAFPLRDWTHDDVWNYIERHKLAVQTNRYDPIARTELKDKRANGDYFEACTACIDKRNDKFVRCPRLNGALVNNVSDQIEYKDLPLPYYGEKTNV